MALSIQRAGADGYRSACSLHSVEGVPGDSNPLPIDPRPIDRRDTDESLREERTTTDELLGLQDQEPRAVRVVRQGRSAAVEQLRDARADVDARLEKRADSLPEVSSKLEQVAENLSQAAASLTGVAESLKEPAAVPPARKACRRRGRHRADVRSAEGHGGVGRAAR